MVMKRTEVGDNAPDLPNQFIRLTKFAQLLLLSRLTSGPSESNQGLRSSLFMLERHAEFQTNAGSSMLRILLIS